MSVKQQHHGVRKDQADGQGEGRRDPFEATRPQPQDVPSRRSPSSPTDEKEERSDLADVGEADEQKGPVNGVPEDAARQDPPATLPQDQR